MAPQLKKGSYDPLQGVGKSLLVFAFLRAVVGTLYSVASDSLMAVCDLYCGGPGSRVVCRAIVLLRAECEPQAGWRDVGLLWRLWWW